MAFELLAFMLSDSNLQGFVVSMLSVHVEHQVGCDVLWDIVDFA